MGTDDLIHQRFYFLRGAGLKLMTGGKNNVMARRQKIFIVAEEIADKTLAAISQHSPFDAMDTDAEAIIAQLVCSINQAEMATAKPFALLINGLIMA